MHQRVRYGRGTIAWVAVTVTMDPGENGGLPFERACSSVPACVLAPESLPKRHANMVCKRKGCGGPSKLFAMEY
jgi:hypothetical protein